MSSTRVRRGQGRVEFLANLPTIREQRRAGKTAAMTYENLKSNGQMTISYKQFWKYWTKMPDIPALPSSPPVSPSSVPAPAASTAPAMPEAGAPAALPPAEGTALPKKRGRRRRTDKAVQAADGQAGPRIPDNADFIPTAFPID